MTALSADKIRSKRGAPAGVEKIAIATSATLYVGSIVSRRKTTGRAVAVSVATNQRIAGVCYAIESDAAGFGASGVGDTSGTVYAHVEYGNEHLVTIKTAIRTNAALGVNVVCADDDSVGGTATGTNTGLNQVIAGELVAFEASDKSTGWLAARRFADTKIAV